MGVLYTRARGRVGEGARKRMSNNYRWRQMIDDASLLELTKYRSDPPQITMTITDSTERAGVKKGQASVAHFEFDDPVQLDDFIETLKGIRDELWAEGVSK